MAVLGVLMLVIVGFDAYGFDVGACLKEVEEERGPFAALAEAIHILGGDL